MRSHPDSVCAASLEYKTPSDVDTLSELDEGRCEQKSGGCVPIPTQCDMYMYV